MTSDSKISKSRKEIYKDLMGIICGDNDAIFFPSPRMVLDKLEQQPTNELVSVANALVWLATGRKIPETGDPAISGVNADISHWCSEHSKRLEASRGQKLSNPTPLPDLWKESVAFAFQKYRFAYRQSDLLDWANARVFSSTTEAQQAGMV